MNTIGLHLRRTPEYVIRGSTSRMEGVEEVEEVVNSMPRPSRESNGEVRLSQNPQRFSPRPWHSILEGLRSSSYSSALLRLSYK